MNLRIKRCWSGLMAWAALTGIAVAQVPNEPEGSVKLGQPPVTQASPEATEGTVQLGTPPAADPGPLTQLSAPGIGYGGANGGGGGGNYFPFQNVDNRYQPRYNVDSRGGGLYGYNGGYTTIGAFVPFSIDADDEAIFFVDGRGLITYDNQGGGANVGAGWRWWMREFDSVVGLSTWYDNSNGGIGPNFNQVGLSFEYLSRYVDYRINGYIPVGSKDHIGTSGVSSTPSYLGSNIVFQRSTQVAQSYTGFDIETGGPLPLIGRYGVNGYIGGYHFMGAGQSGGSFTGVSGRFLAQINEDVSFGMQVTSDHTFGLNTQFQVFVTLPDGMPSRWMRNPTVQDRMTQSVFRQFRAITHVDTVKSFDLAINPTTDAPYFVAHVNPNDTVPGDGTVEHPFDSIKQFNDLVLAQKGHYDIILVNSRTDNTDTNLNTGVQLLNNQRLLGAGISHTFTTTTGTYTLPPGVTFGTPLLSNTGMSGSAVVTLANNNEVSGFKIDGRNTLGLNPLNNGIVSQGGGITGFNINQNTIVNTFDGVNITNTGNSVGLITNNTLTGLDPTLPAGAVANSGIQVVQTAGALDLLVRNNTVSGIQGTTLVPGTAISIAASGATAVINADNPSPAATTPATQPTGIDGNTVTIQGGGNGISLGADNGGKLNLVVSGNSVTGDWTATASNLANTGFGISVAADTNGVVNLLQYTNNTTTGVYGDGTRFAANGGGTFLLGDGDLTTDDSFVGNTFQNNAGDGLFVGATGGQLVMEDIQNYIFSGNQKNGLELNAQTGGSIIIGDGTGNNLITGNTFTDNGMVDTSGIHTGNGALISATGGNASITAVFGDPTVPNTTTNTFTANSLDNIKVVAEGAGTVVQTVFTGISASRAGTNGFDFNASNGATLYAVMTGGVSADNNSAGNGVSFVATDATTKAVLYMSEANGINTFNGNGATAMGTAGNQIAGAGVVFDAQNVAEAGLRFMGTANTNGNAANVNNDVNGDGIGDSDGVFVNVNGATTTALEIAGTTTATTTFNTNQNSGLGLFLNNTALGQVTVPTIGGFGTQTFGSSGIVLDRLSASSNVQGDGMVLSLHDLMGTPDVTITNNTAVNNGQNGFSIDLLRTDINNLTVQNNQGFLASPSQYSYALDIAQSPGIGSGLEFLFSNTSATQGVDITSIDLNLVGTAGGIKIGGTGGLVYDTSPRFTLGDPAADPLSFLSAANMQQVGLSALNGDLIQLTNPIPTGLTTGNALTGGGPFDQLNKKQDLNLAFDPTLPVNFDNGKTFGLNVGVAGSVNVLNQILPANAGGFAGATVTVTFSNGQTLQNVIPGSATVNPQHTFFQSPTGALKANGLDGLHVVQNYSSINNAIIDNNTLSSNGSTGINFATVANSQINSMQITNNHLDANQSNGLAMNISGASTVNNVTIASNSITGNGAATGNGNGISINVAGTDTTNFSQLNNLIIGGPTVASQNIISGNAGDGISITRTTFGQVNNAQIQFNDVNTNGGNGISLTASNVNTTDTYTIANNGITSNGLDGIHLSVQADAIMAANIDSNLIDGNGGSGIHTVEQANTATDLRSVSGFWTRNTITSNTLDGIDLAAPSGDGVNNLVIGDPVDTTLGNVISNNLRNGVNVEGAGDVVIGSNLISSNGTAGTVGTANESAGIMANVLPVSNLTIINNQIINNIGDGIQYGINRSAIGSGQVQIIGNNVAFNDGRGLDILNLGGDFIQVTVDGNIFNRNLLEGVYVVNTSSRTQNQFNASTMDLAADGSVFSNPVIEMQFTNNQVIGNGYGTTLYPSGAPTATGLVVRVGTSGATSDPTDPGGFASTGGPVAVGGSPFGTSTFEGGVTMTVDNNQFTGNFGDDLMFASFISTVNPNSGTAWDLGAAPPTFNTNGYQSDPLARLDLYFRNNTYDGEGQSTAIGINNYEGIRGANGHVVNQSTVAYYNNADDTFKSRNGKNNNDPTQSGPFTNPARRRNAQRQASRSILGFTNPTNPVGASFLYPGLGESTFRVSSDSDTTDFLLDNEPVTSQADWNGYNFINNNTVGEAPFGWGSF